MAEYIKRETVIKHLRECEGTPPEIGYTYPIFKALECFIEEVPAADVVEVVQAAWTDKGFCTNCGHRAYIACVGFNCTGGTRVTYERTPYCAGCGAKMDRKDDT